MGFSECIRQQPYILMEGALGERLKREYHLQFDTHVAMARLVYDPRGRAALQQLWMEYIAIARSYGLPFLATTPTRRANRQRVMQANCDPSIIPDNVKFLREIQQASGIEMYVGGLMGCKGDAYTGQGALSEQQSKDFHQWQADLFRQAGVDFLYAGIMPTLPEATGMALAMEATGLPYSISLTIQGDGRLIDGTTLADAIAYMDSATNRNPVCYMTNCVHPSIVSQALAQPFNANDLVRRRFLGIQANTSPLPYAQLDDSADLQCATPEAFAEAMLLLRNTSSIKIFGGCCGTDNKHMEEVARRLG